MRNLSPNDVVISGGARGVDTVAVDTAKALGIPTMVFPAEWDKHGKKAGYMRNELIVAAADMVVAFHDGTSKGTQHSIDIAKRMGKTCEVVL